MYIYNYIKSFQAKIIPKGIDSYNNILGILILNVFAFEKFLKHFINTRLLHLYAKQIFSSKQFALLISAFYNFH